MDHAHTQSYRDLTAWRKSILLVVEVYRVSRKLPGDERFGLTAQLRRAAISVGANIAEGHGSSHRNTFLRHLAIARGSLMEVESLLHVAECLEYVTTAESTIARQLLDETSRLITALKRALANSTRPDPGTLGTVTERGETQLR